MSETDRPQLVCTSECPECGKTLDLGALVMHKAFRIMGCTLQQIIHLCALWRARRMDWPPEGEPLKDALKGYEDGKSSGKSAV